ncbi:MAG: SDR family NAD(P)-dependent oxidoreductase, partial [Prochloraceae cyanobacterium]|nr:SDR family NAD(P)-dependent oxidoreductase [Prochloraceae cyanobacterium]
QKQGSGRILNIASSAALAAAPGYALYAASKAFILEFSHSLAAEVNGNGISLSCLIPGPTRTQFCRRAGLRESPGAMEPKAVARYALDLMERGLPTGTPGIANKLKQTLKRLLPFGLWGCLAKWYMMGRISNANS